MNHYFNLYLSTERMYQNIMNTLTYENLHETKKHVSIQFPYNTYLCSIPLDFTQVPLHWHNDVEIIVIKKGCGIISVDTEPKVVKAGDIILVRPGQLHSIAQHGKDRMEYENILFQTSLLYSDDSDPCTVGYFHPYFSLEYELPWLFDDSFSCHQELSSCIETIDQLCSRKPHYYELSVKGHLFHFFYLLFSSQGAPVTFYRSKSLEKVKQIVSYIELHYAEEITIQIAADYMGFSESHFMKFFKQHLHTTFTSYLNGYRLTIAARLLLTEDDSILSISERTGFNNLSYFNRLFKKEYQMSPREYRNR